MARATERVAVLMTPEEKQALEANLKQVELSASKAERALDEVLTEVRAALQAPR